MIATSEQAEYVGMRDLAKIIGASRAHLEHLKSQGRLPRHTVVSPKIHRWLLSDIHLWMSWGCPSRDEFERLKAAQKR